MAAPFSAVPIPFLAGLRQDLGKLAQESPSQLRIAQNVVFTKKGHITGRPGLVNRDDQAQTSGAGGALVADLGTATSGAIPSGIVSTGFSGQNAADGDTPLACWQGSAYYHRGLNWTLAGKAWSFRQTKSAILRTYDPTNASRTNPVPVGPSIVGTVTTGAGSTGFPILNDAGEITGISLGTGANFTSDSNHCMAGDAIFFISNTGNVFAQLPGVLPAVTQVSLMSGADTSTIASQLTSALIGPDGFYYLAVKSATAGRINVLRIATSGSVTQNLALNGLGSVQNLAIVHNGIDRLGLAYQDTLGPNIKTKVLSITAGTMADTALNLTLTGTSLVLSGMDVGTLAAGVSHNGFMSVLYTTNTGNLYIGGRTFGGAVESSFTQLVSNGLAQEKEWNPLFAGVVLGGRTLVGVVNAVDLFNQSSQWLVMDVTSLYASGATSDRAVVAAGPYLGMARMVPSTPYTTLTSISFAVAEGLSFSPSSRAVPVIQRAGIRRITLSLQPTQAAHVNGVTLLSGQLLHVFDGSVVRPDHFAEEAPFIFSTSVAVAGGTLAAGSYTYQATWEMVNASGQTVRSGASNQKTMAVALNQRVLLDVARPQLHSSLSQLEFVRIRLWATKVNPTNNAALYFVTEAIITNPSTGTPVIMEHANPVTGTEEQLYETATILADMRAPGADRGVAYALERAWVADQSKLYASKLIRPGLAPAWNTEDTNVISLPASLGSIQSLAAVNQGLVVLCSRGAAVVTGPGVDDTGAGPGWSLQILDGIPGMGTSSPRSAVSTPAGVMFQAVDGDIWLASGGNQAVPVSRAARDSALVNSAFSVDLVNLASTPTSNTMLVAHGAGGILRVLDMEMGQWGTWQFSGLSTAGVYLASVNGALWLQVPNGFAPSVVYSLDGASAQDAIDGSLILSTIETGTVKQSNPTPRGWGRLRSIVLNEVRTSADNQSRFRVRVFADQNDRVLLDKTRVSFPTNTTTFPGAGDGALEFRTTVQRCAHFRVRIDIDQATFSLEGLTAWVANTGLNSPTNNRS